MTRPCSGCGLWKSCICDEEPDEDGDPEMEAWLAQVAREEAEMAARINQQLEPKRRVA